MKALPILAALALTACGGANSPPLDLCKTAELRRTAYATTITVADAWAYSGRPVPASVSLARQAAVTALALLDVNCPVVAA